MNDGFAGIARTFVLGFFRVPSAFGFGGLSKPTWLSLILQEGHPGRARAASAEPDEPERIAAAGTGQSTAGGRPGHAFQNAAAVPDARIFIRLHRGGRDCS